MQSTIRPESILKQVKVATPCPANWDEMVGDERTRYCSACKLHVYNLSGMNANETAELVQSAEGRLCIRYYRRSDGTIMTKDCPVGVRALRKRMAWTLVHAAALCLVMVGAARAYALRHDVDETGLSPLERAKEQARQLPVVGSVVEWLDPQPRFVVGAMAPTPIMGNMPAPAQISAPPSSVEVKP